MKFFSVDGALYKFLSRLWDMIKLNFLWLLFSLPIVTIGAATVAAYSVTLKMVDESEGYVARQFVKAFKQNWKQGIPLGLLAIFCSYVVYLDFEMFNKIENNPIILAIFGIVAAFVFGLAFIYAFPLSARYENTLLGTLKNSVNIAVRYFVRTLFLVLILAFELILIFFNTTTLFFGLLIGPACIMLTISGFAMYFFRQIEKEPGAVRETTPEEKEVK
ncbi:MAG: YesL family protein [Lachnospiraceae bacterium]|nr:YesL family protein [Lachnospiraceae bacterium]MBQ7782099.1 YesL family protein [Lachnospiraceae bacterium]